MEARAAWNWRRDDLAVLDKIHRKGLGYGIHGASLDGGLGCAQRCAWLYLRPRGGIDECSFLL